MVRWICGGLAALVILLELVAVTGVTTAPHVSLLMHESGSWLPAAMMAGFVLFVRKGSDRREIGITLLIGSVLSTLLWRAGSASSGSPGALVARALSVCTTSLGASGLIFLGSRALLVDRDQRAAARRRLCDAAVFPLLGLISASMDGLTAALHPYTLDGAALGLEAGVYGQPSFVLGRVFDTFPSFSRGCAVIISCLPIGVALLTVRRERAGDPLVATSAPMQLTVALLLGFAAQHVTPVAGPHPAFLTYFPFEVPQALSLSSALAAPMPRAALPSIPFAWALLLLWLTRPERGWVRITSVLITALTALAALGHGEGYAVTLSITIPFAVAVEALVTRHLAREQQGPSKALLVSISLFLFWLVALRLFPARLADWAWMSRLAMLVTIVTPLMLRLERFASVEKRPHAHRSIHATEPATEPASGHETTASVTALFFLSGFAGLVYEVVFGKSLALTFGSTAQASATVLATYMGGTALGAWAGGRIGSRRVTPLKVYAWSELGIGLWCALTPLLFTLIRTAYVAIAARPDPGPPAIALQSALGGGAILPATFLMGVTMPVLARRFLQRGDRLARTVSLLYGANTLGAAVGALMAGYVLLPTFGVTRSTLIAVGLNVGAAWIALTLARRETSTRHAGPSRDESSPSPSSSSVAIAPPTPARATSGSAHERVTALVILVGGGVVTLALEVVYTHLLAVVAGNSAYAFSLMLFAFLLGLGLGAAAVRRFLGGRPATLLHAGALELGLSCAILAGVFVWEQIPAYFGSFEHYPLARSFGAREVVRFASCCVAMVPPAVFIGALYPVAIECASRARGPGAEVGALGRAAALNTLGNVLGAFACSFVLLPRLGSLHTLYALAALALLLGLSPLVTPGQSRARGWQLPALALLAVGLFVARPRGFDLTRLASGTNVYFATKEIGTIIDHAESSDGGLTTVGESLDPSGRREVTLYTNGKFQGNDSQQRKAQFGFALCPLLHTAQRENGLVIGFGTGATARVLRDAGFARTDIVELSGDILTMANRYFAELNGHVLDDPRVHPFVNDGRSFLLLQRRTYDLIAIELTSIWFSGAAALYNQEFYAIVKERLSHGGVVEQWVQLHHLSRADLASIIATLRSTFPKVWLYLTGAQGMLVACEGSCEPGPAAISAIERAPALAEVLSFFGGDPRRALDDVLLGPDQIDNLLASSQAGGIPAVVSTDDNLHLEYETPRGNASNSHDSAVTNEAWLRTFSAPRQP